MSVVTPPSAEYLQRINEFPLRPIEADDAGRTFAFVAVILDCIDDAAKAFYQRFDFQALPGHSSRLFLSAQRLEAMMECP